MKEQKQTRDCKEELMITCCRPFLGQDRDDPTAYCDRCWRGLNQKQACLDLIKYMEERRSEWNNKRPFIEPFKASQMLDTAKEYLKTL